MQRRGLMLLNSVACPKLLDQIWAVHIAADTDPERFGAGPSEKWVLYEESFGALKLSADAHPEWLVAKIQHADICDPIHDLGWLVARSRDGATAWNRCKAALFSKVAPDKPRVLATNIGEFRDTDEVPWLVRHIDDRADSCGPVALRALSRIDPDRAVDLLTKMRPFDLYATRSWCFAEVFRRRPDNTHACMLAWMRGIDDPWVIGLVFDGRENELLPEQLEVLLDGLDALLAETLSTPLDVRNPSPHRELHFLANISTPPLLEVLRRYGDHRLAGRLKEYIETIGPQRGAWRDSLERGPAMAVLSSMRADLAATVVAQFLHCDDRFGRHEASKWTFRVLDDAVLASLNAVVKRSETWDGPYPREQNDALVVLALRERWEDVARGLERWGLNTGVEFTDERLVPWDYHSDWVGQLRQTLSIEPTSGRVLALAFAGAKEDAPLLQRLLRQSQESELTHACIIGLRMLADISDEGVQLVIPFLRSQRHHDAAVRMLTAAGTRAAWNALFADLQLEFDYITALNLINLSDHADEVVDLINREMPKQQRIDFWSLLTYLAPKHSPPRVKASRILANQWIRNTLHQMSLSG